MTNRTPIHVATARAATALAVACVLATAQSLAAQDSPPQAEESQRRGEDPRLKPRFSRPEVAQPRTADTPSAGREQAVPPQARGPEQSRPRQDGDQANAQRRGGGREGGRRDGRDRGGRTGSGRDDGGRDGGTVIIDGSRGPRGRAQAPPPRVYATRPRGQIAPRRIYPYAYGAFGLGYFYYDPYWSPWGPRGGWGYPGGYGGYSGYYDGGRRDGLGTVRLDVKGPKEAQVLVDGYYAGELDDFDGAFQGLDLESGTYRIEVVAEGFESLTFDTRVIEGRKLTLHGALHRAEN